MNGIVFGTFASLALLFALGGCDSPLPDISREAHAATPQGEASTRELPGSAVLFPAINVLDLKATQAFYMDMLDMKVTLKVGEEGDDHQEVTLNFSGEIYAPEASLVLNYVASRSEPYIFDAFSRIAFRVPDVDAAVERMRAAGHKILSEPRMIDVEGAGIKLAFVEDPNGARVELIQTVVPSEASADAP